MSKIHFYYLFLFQFQAMPLHKVMESVTGRRYLSMFLETLCSQGLVGFWSAVEELRHSPRSSWHQLGAEIFYTYIRSPSAEVKVDKVNINYKEKKYF